MSEIAQARLKYVGSKREVETLPTQNETTCTTTQTNDIFQNLSDEIVINENNALTISAVYACIKVISEGLAIAPIQLIYKKDNVRKKATSHSLYKLLGKKPNSYSTPSDFKKIYILHMALTGAFYAQKMGLPIEKLIVSSNKKVKKVSFHLVHTCPYIS